MNTLFLKSDIEELRSIVEKLKQAQASAEMWSAGEDTEIDKYAYKYGAMVGQVNSAVDSFESRLALLETSLGMGITKQA